MEIKKKNGKVKMILTDEYLIIKRFIRDIKIKRTDIRSAFLAENYLVIVTYDSKVFRMETTFADADYIRSLKLLINEINKEDILIQSMQRSWWLCGVMMFNSLNINLSIDGYSLLEIIFLIIMFIVMLIAVAKLSIYMNIKMAYIIESKEFHVFTYKGDIKKVFTRDEVTSGDNTGYITKYKYKNKRESFTLEKPIYPVACLNANIELEIATRRKNAI